MKSHVIFHYYPTTISIVNEVLVLAIRVFVSENKNLFSRICLPLLAFDALQLYGDKYTHLYFLLVNSVAVKKIGPRLSFDIIFLLKTRSCLYPRSSLLDQMNKCPFYSFDCFPWLADI